MERTVGIAILLVSISVSVSASAAPMLLEFSFDRPGWTGSITFDDTSGQPWSVIASSTAYDILSMSITDGTAAWDETEVIFSGPPGGGVIADNVGAYALFSIASDTETGLVLSSTAVFTAGLIKTGRIQLSDPLTGEYLRSDYTLTPGAQPIPEPTSAVLFGAGALVAGTAVRRMRGVRRMAPISPH